MSEHAAEDHAAEHSQMGAGCTGCAWINDDPSQSLRVAHAQHVAEVALGNSAEKDTYDGHTLDVGYVHVLNEDRSCRDNCPHPDHSVTPSGKDGGQQ